MTLSIVRPLIGLSMHCSAKSPIGAHLTSQRRQEREYDIEMMDQPAAMSRTDKVALITPWINPEERITVQFDDQRDINTVVTGCSEQLVDLALETPVPHLPQKLSIPLSELDVSEDPTHYTRDPTKPLQFKRLLLIVKGKRPAIIY